MSIGEYLEGDDGRGSLTKLLCFLSFVPSTIEMFILKSENALLYYLGAFVIGYIGGKSADAYKAKNQSRYREGDLKWQR